MQQDPGRKQGSTRLMIAAHRPAKPGALWHAEFNSPALSAGALGVTEWLELNSAEFQDLRNTYAAQLQASCS